MEPIFSLWLPIVLSAVVVFILSSVIHMMLGYHSNDFQSLPSEKAVMEDLRKYNIAQGEYSFPKPKSMKEMGTEEYIEKYRLGPVGFLTVMKGGKPGMTSELVLWFLYSILVGIFAAYVTGHALAPGAHYLSVFRFAGTTAFVGYSLALLQNSIWYKRKWSSTFKSMFDGLIYALFTGGIFGWLWPAM